LQGLEFSVDWLISSVLHVVPVPATTWWKKRLEEEEVWHVHGHRVKIETAEVSCRIYSRETQLSASIQDESNIIV
jgi:hypothetical protein